MAMNLDLNTLTNALRKNIFFKHNKRTILNNYVIFLNENEHFDDLESFFSPPMGNQEKFLIVFLIDRNKWMQTFPIQG